eukprot:7369120-Prymnesium_polylepis.1
MTHTRPTRHDVDAQAPPPPPRTSDIAPSPRQCLLFYDHNGGGHIALKWRPAAFVPAPLKASDAQHRMLLQRAGGGKAKEGGGSFAIPDVAATLEALRAASGGLIKRVRLTQHLGAARLCAALSA